MSNMQVFNETLEVVTGVTIPVEEYRELVENSTRLEVVKDYLKANKYVDKREIKVLLGINEEEGEV